MISPQHSPTPALRRVPGQSVSIGHHVAVPIPGGSAPSEQVQVLRETDQRTRIVFKCACGKTTTLLCEAE